MAWVAINPFDLNSSVHAEMTPAKAMTIGDGTTMTRGSFNPEALYKAFTDAYTRDGTTESVRMAFAIHFFVCASS